MKVLSLIRVACMKLIRAIAVLESLVPLAFVTVTILPCMDALAVGLALEPLPDI
jgi:hypothetical protein